MISSLRSLARQIMPRTGQCGRLISADRRSQGTALPINNEDVHEILKTFHPIYGKDDGFIARVVPLASKAYQRALRDDMASRGDKTEPSAEQLERIRTNAITGVINEIDDGRGYSDDPGPNPMTGLLMLYTDTLFEPKFSVLTCLLGKIPGYPF